MLGAGRWGSVSHEPKLDVRLHGANVFRASVEDGLKTGRPNDDHIQQWREARRETKVNRMSLVARIKDKSCRPFLIRAIMQIT